MLEPKFFFDWKNSRLYRNIFNKGMSAHFTQSKQLTALGSDRDTVSVDANDQGGAGRILIKAEALNLDNSSLLASTLSGEGGNINLTISEILTLNNNSFISAQAFNNVNGGNLTIDRFSIAVEAKLRT